jgi:hypothetical protein
LQISQNGNFYTLDVNIGEADFRKFQADYRSESNSFNVPVKISWRDGSDVELASNQINLIVKGVQEESQCKEAALTWKSTTRDLSMSYDSEGSETDNM